MLTGRRLSFPLTCHSRAKVKHSGPPPTSLQGTGGRGLGSHNEIESQMDAMGISMGWEVRSRARSASFDLKELPASPPLCMECPMMGRNL